MNGEPSLPDAREKEIFGEARKIDDPKERAAYLARECGENHALRASVEALLRNDTDNDFLNDIAEKVRPSEVVVEKIGDTIDRYTILEEIGEGGYGIVYRARQHGPLGKEFALKVIKPGMDTRQVLRRFETERKALAELDEHPSIATVFDAGSTRTGRPYFVMGLVRGTHITDYANHYLLTIPQRLELFAKVCLAIQYAHDKKIIHRDIKPSNIIVAATSGEHWPKVIDFGIAKITAGDEADKTTLATRTGQFVGTPAYMSPEQAGLGGVAIDGRTDIYSLGVLLYELMIGCLPLAVNGLGEYEQRRIIMEEKPQQPSDMFTALGEDDKVRTAQCRHTEPSFLLTCLYGDLDRIVMKCLAKDRAQRYATAHSLMLDIQGYVDDQGRLQQETTIHDILNDYYQINRLIDDNMRLIRAQPKPHIHTMCPILIDAYEHLRSIKSSSCPTAFAHIWSEYLKAYVNYIIVIASLSQVTSYSLREGYREYEEKVEGASRTLQTVKRKIDDYRLTTGVRNNM